MAPTLAQMWGGGGGGGGGGANPATIVPSPSGGAPMVAPPRPESVSSGLRPHRPPRGARGHGRHGSDGDGRLSDARATAGAGAAGAAGRRAASGHGAGGDPYRAAMRAAVRSDSTRCGRLEASIVLKLCARYRLHVPQEMAEAARAKAILSYVKFIDKLQKVHQGEPATPM